jgi:cystathionine beta-synthase
VIEEQHVVGIIDESDVLFKVATNPAHFTDLVGDTMSRAIETLPPKAGLDALRRMLNRGLVAVIVENGRFYGLITRFDLLNHLRRSVQ